VLFVTIEDETGIANLVVWPQVFERQRRIILAAGMLGVQGRIQREARWCIWSPGISPICRRTWPASVTRHSGAAWPGRRIPSRQPGPRSSQPAQRAEAA
jgi:DNA polymerase III alpha subunit